MMEVRAKKAKDLDEEAARARAEVMERIDKSRRYFLCRETTRN